MTKTSGLQWGELCEGGVTNPSSLMPCSRIKSWASLRPKQLNSPRMLSFRHTRVAIVVEQTRPNVSRCITAYLQKQAGCPPNGTVQAAQGPNMQNETKRTVQAAQGPNKQNEEKGTVQAAQGPNMQNKTKGTVQAAQGPFMQNKTKRTVQAAQGPNTQNETKRTVQAAQGPNTQNEEKGTVQAAQGPIVQTRQSGRCWCTDPRKSGTSGSGMCSRRSAISSSYLQPAMWRCGGVVMW
jgi:hypothetical protein